MKIALFKSKANSMQRCFGMVRGERVIDLSLANSLYREKSRAADIPELATWPQFLGFFMERRDAVEKLIEFAGGCSQETGVIKALNDVGLCAPVEHPRNIICVGRNYLAHARETGHEAPREPILFAKSPSAVIDPGEAIVYPSPSR